MACHMLACFASCLLPRAFALNYGSRFWLCAAYLSGSARGRVPGCGRVRRERDDVRLVSPVTRPVSPFRQLTSECVSLGLRFIIICTTLYSSNKKPRGFSELPTKIFPSLCVLLVRSPCVSRLDAFHC